MFETNIVIIGNVLTAPEWRRTSRTNALVAHFKVASTARRRDRETGNWVDGNSLRVRVSCWRKLAEGVSSSVMVGDPVIVTGRLYTRDWTDTDGNARITYEMEAVAIGHDLARGRATFQRNRPALGTSELDGLPEDAPVRDGSTASVAGDESPTLFGDGFADDDEPDFSPVPPSAPAGYDPIAVVRGGGFEPFDVGSSAPDEEDLAPFDTSDAETGSAESRTSDGKPARGRLPGRSPAAGSPAVELPIGGEPGADGTPADSADVAAGEPLPTRRPRRNGRRLPVPV